MIHNIQDSQMPRLISIEGNIGAGKSTFVRKLQEQFKHDPTIIFLQEPVDIWESVKDEEGKTILQKFYEDSKKYAFAFQVLAFTTRLKNIQKTIENAPPECKAIIMERSLEADRFIFAAMLRDGKLMECVEHVIYRMYSEEAMLKYRVNNVIWLATPPEECAKRIQNRKRDGEDDISLDYLKVCHKYHEAWLNDHGNVMRIEDNTETIEKYELLYGDNRRKWIGLSDIAKK